MGKMFANLHTHSTHSDGEYTPTELVGIAKKEGYRAIALSDHDTATGYPELQAACKEEEMECIFAVEFSVKVPDDYHIVGFDFDPEYPPMKAYLDAMGERQTGKTRAYFEAAVENGTIKGITWDEVLEYNKDVKWLCNDHLFRVMASRGMVKRTDYIAWYLSIFQNPEVKYEATIEFLELKELIALIKAAGGIAVVAHPHNKLDQIDFLVECGIEGLEVWHSDLTEEEKERALQIGLEKRLYISGGSDHSGICGGMYSTFASEQELRQSPYYIEQLSTGTTEEFFRELQKREFNR